jgi:hypothetical protein
MAAGRRNLPQLFELAPFYGVLRVASSAHPSQEKYPVI